MLVVGLAAGVGPIAINALVKLGGGYDAPLMMMGLAGVLALLISIFFNNSRVPPTEAGLVQQGF
jgi:hypothetical protein